MTEIVLEESEKSDGTIVRLVRKDDGTEQRREYRYSCSICGAPLEEPAPQWALSCLRRDCRL